MTLLRPLILGFLILSLAAPAVGPAEALEHGAAKSEKPAAKPKGGKEGHEAKGKEGEHGEEKAKAGDDGGLFSSQDNLVEIPTIIAPVLCNDRLSAHLYIYIAALTADASQAQEVKMRLPYIQDALVRDVNDNTLTIADPKADPDTKTMLARFKSVINQAVGKPLVTDIQVGRIDTAPY